MIAPFTCTALMGEVAELQGALAQALFHVLRGGSKADAIALMASVSVCSCALRRITEPGLTEEIVPYHGPDPRTTP